MTTMTRPPAWAVLEQALRQRRPVQASYHGRLRLLCPHILGWKSGRAKILAYQAGGDSSHGPLTAEPTQRWRSMFIDDLEDVVITDQPWHTADNYTPDTNGIDRIAVNI